MATSASKLRLDGLTRLDLLELKRLAPAGAIEEEQPNSSDEHGEPLTIGIITVSAAALSALSVWLVTPHDKKSFTRSVEIIEADGSVHRESVGYKESSRKSPNAEVLKQLSKLTRIDVGQILSDMGGTTTDGDAE
jgi:hypothetical protein